MGGRGKDRRTSRLTTDLTKVIIVKMSTGRWSNRPKHALGILGTLELRTPGSKCHFYSCVSYLFETGPHVAQASPILTM